MRSVAVPLLAVSAIALEGLDVISTYHMLVRGGQEANPIVRWFMQVLGDAWPLCKIPELVLIIIIWKVVPRPIAVVFLGFMVASYGFVVWYNYQL
jgi:hypothetical protein